MTRTLIVVLAILSFAGKWSDSQHLVLTAEHTLRPQEREELAAKGVEIQQVLPGARYIVRVTDAGDLAADPRVRSLEAIPAAKKIGRSALREAAKANAFARVRLVFHDDVSFADAQRAVERVGGIVEGALATEYALPQRLHARVPFGMIEKLAADDAVFAIFGPPMQLKRTNANAALLSSVTPLYSAPYNLTGSGVVLSQYELAAADASHAEFGGRLVPHLIGGAASDRSHATHVAGTMIASGILPAARGMAPSATLHEFDVRPDYDIVLHNKETQLPGYNVVADNNSWGFALGWQFTPGAPNSIAWYGGDELFGAYEAFYSSPYDKITRTTSTLFIQSSGNEADAGQPSFSNPQSAHGHIDDATGALLSGTFCYSQNGTGTDCTSPCSSGPAFCETSKHPAYGPFDTLGPTGSLKNVIAVGAVNQFRAIASFSSRGPTDDGRVKPDFVAKGTSQVSTVPGGYSVAQGTSMSTPVVTGIAALITEQWRRNYSGQTPLPVTIKTLLTAGAEDLGTPGPDYTFGFGLANAKAAVDLIMADRGVGSRVRVATIGQGQTVEIPLTVFGTQNLRVVLGWFDPEVVLHPDEFASKTLINDLDVRVIDPNGNAVLPYVLDKNNPLTPATRGVNTVDNTEEVEIANAGPGTYRVQISGTTVASGATQQYVLVANSILGALDVACDDQLEPNNTEATAFGFLLNNQPVSGVTCSATDLDFYRVRPTAAGPLTVTVTATDTPLKLTVGSVSTTIAAGTSGSVTLQVVPGPQVIRVEPAGTLGATRQYTLATTFASAPTTRRRAVR